MLNVSKVFYMMRSGACVCVQELKHNLFRIRPFFLLIFGLK